MRSLSHSGSRARLQQAGGFTLVELMMAAAIATFILAAVLSSYICMLRGFTALANYAQIHQQAGIAVEKFAKDMREVNNVASFTSSYLKVSIPTNFTATGTISGTNIITWSYTNQALRRTESITGLTRTLATNVTSLTLSLYDKNGSNTATLSSAKGVQIDIHLRKDVQSRTVSEDFRSARFDLRNVP